MALGVYTFGELVADPRTDRRPALSEVAKGIERFATRVAPESRKATEKKAS